MTSQIVLSEFELRKLISGGAIERDGNEIKIENTETDKIILIFGHEVGRRQGRARQGLEPSSASNDSIKRMMKKEMNG